MLGCYWKGECFILFYYAHTCFSSCASLSFPSVFTSLSRRVADPFPQNGGHCQPNTYIPPPHISHWELANFSFLRSFIALNNITCDWQDTQGVHGFYNKAIFDVAVLDAAANALLDPELAKQVRIVRPEDTELGYNFKDLRLNQSCVGAIVQENAASLWPYKLVCWVLEKLLEDFPVARSGDEATESSKPTFNIQTLTPVTSISPSKSGSGMGWWLQTPRGAIAADQVLLCTNAYTSHLLPSMTDLIVPVRGQMSALLPPRATSEQPLSGKYSYGFIGNASHTSKQDDYLVQRPFRPSEGDGDEKGGGELMFGGGRGAATAFGMPSYRIGDDSIIDNSVARYLRTSLNSELDINNENGELKASHEWSGIMGYSRDGYPWVGQVPQEMLEDGKGGLFVCAGFTGHGMANASLAARWCAQNMLKGGAHFKGNIYGKVDHDVKVVSRKEGKDRKDGKEKIKMPQEMLITAERRERAMGELAVQVVDLMEDDLHL